MVFCSIFAVSEFNRLFKAAIDKVAPYREVRVRSKGNPWMNSHILSLIRKRDITFSRFKADRSNTQLYKEFCQLLNVYKGMSSWPRKTFSNGKLSRIGVIQENYGIT